MGRSLKEQLHETEGGVGSKSGGVDGAAVADENDTSCYGASTHRCMHHCKHTANVTCWAEGGADSGISVGESDATAVYINKSMTVRFYTRGKKG